MFSVPKTRNNQKLGKKIDATIFCARTSPYRQLFSQIFHNTNNTLVVASEQGPGAVRTNKNNSILFASEITPYLFQ